MKHIEPGNRATGRDQRGLIAAAWEQIAEFRARSESSATRVAQFGMMDGRIDTPLADSLPGYEVIREIHRGGQGVVYEATQRSTRRQVAIKVMREGPFAGPRERARFEREVQILAQLRHPNIVTIHDSGTAGAGSYIVMDYIPGAPLNQYVRQRELSLRERLQLMAQICRAVHAAHLHGITHRDLKPGNIRIDPNGQPHILDFGLAKRSDWADDASDAVTMTGQFVGSLPWASPEQAEGRLDQIDVRTDVYALGIILYEMLTGTFPYCVTGSLREVANNIVTREPTPPRDLNRAMPDEVAAITMKCIKKPRDERYQSAGEVARDIERYLRGEPIEAKGDSFAYVIRKGIGRHKLAASVILGFVFVLAAGLGTSLTFWRIAAVAAENEKKQHQSARASAAEARAQQLLAKSEAEKAQAVNKFLTDMLAAANPHDGAGRDVTILETLRAAEQRLEQGAVAHHPKVEASIRHAIGQTYAGIGEYDKAVEQLESAHALLEDSSEDPAALEEKYLYAIELAAVLRVQGKPQEAEAHLRESLAFLRAVPKPSNMRIAAAASSLANVLRGAGRFDEAEALYHEAIELLESADAEDQPGYAQTLNDYAILLSKKGDLKTARELQERVLDAYRRLHGDEHPSVAVAMSNLGQTSVELGDFASAESLFRDALVIARKSLGERHPTIPQYLGSLALLYRHQNRLAEAEVLMQESLDLRREVLGESHPDVATSLSNLAIVKYGLGARDEAAELLGTALALSRKIHGARHPVVQTIQLNLAAVHRSRGDLQKARDMLEQVLRDTRELFGDQSPDTARAAHNLAVVLVELGEYEPAEALFRESLETRRAILGENHVDVGESLGSLGNVLREQKKLDDAEPLLRAAIENATAVFGRAHPRTAAMLWSLSLVHEARGEFEAAETLMREAIEARAPDGRPKDPETILMMSQRAGVFRKMNQAEAALQHAESALRLSEELLVADDWRIAACRREYAMALWETGERDAARLEIRRAVDDLSARFPADHKLVRETREMVEKLEKLAKTAGDAPDSPDSRGSDDPDDASRAAGGPDDRDR